MPSLENVLQYITLRTHPPLGVLITSAGSNFKMAANVGLSTPRGSGTSGYVQSNKAFLRTREKVEPYPKDFDAIKHKQRQPDKEILKHDRKRDIEVKVFELRDRLEDEGYTHRPNVLS